MALPGVDKTFAIEDAAHMVDKLIWEIEQLRQVSPHDPEALSYGAFNCAVTAWIIADWIFFEMPGRSRDAIGCKTVGAYRSWARRQSPWVNICREIATASKHRVIDRGADPDVATAMYAVSVGEDTADEHSISLSLPVWRMVVTSRGKSTDAIDVFRFAAGFWTAQLPR
jgi:hypothetical protein